MVKKVKKNKVIIFTISLIILGLLLFNISSYLYYEIQSWKIKKYLETIQESNLYSDITNKFKDTVNIRSTKIKFKFDYYFESSVEEFVLINKKKNKGVLILSIITPESNNYDIIQPIGFIKRNNNWFFNLNNSPTMNFHRGDNNNKPYSIKMLKQQIVKNLSKNNFISIFSDEVNDEYFDNIYYIKNLEKELDIDK